MYYSANFSKGDQTLANTIFSYARNTRRNGHHTDSSRGALTNYLARMICGAGRFVGEGYDITFYPGEMYFIPIGFRYHSYWIGEPVVWDSISFGWMPENAGYPPQRLFPDERQSRTYDEITANLRYSCAQAGKFYKLLAGLLVNMTPLDGPKPTALFESAARLLRTDYDLSVAEVAKRCNVSETGLYAEFRKLGTTPVKYRMEEQIKRAEKLLVTTDLTALEISEICGFSSEAYFYRVFRRLTGKTTREVRYERMM